ncbi:MAG: DUF262 domain-containing protein [Treponema sp.]|nr:DUF262 domain-containing protein [Treponema sp.]
MSKRFECRSVNTFKGYNFYIPDYQRGYRWTSGKKESEVQYLLSDLAEYFGLKEGLERTKTPFYCMQPLVVHQKSENNWEVLDGQQRLTTFFLILKNLNADNFTLEYETRPSSKEFLQNIGKNPDEDLKNSKKNIDFYHIYNAYYAIKNYFEKNEKIKKQFEAFFLGYSQNQDVQFIWYDVTQEVHSSDDVTDSKSKIFSRLNVGKIGLTNAELVKALLFNRVDVEFGFYFDGKNEDDIGKSTKEKIINELSLPIKLKINSDWDMIEHSLHDNDFWAFICGEKKKKRYSTRIEFILENIIGKFEREDKFAVLNYFKDTLEEFNKTPDGMVFDKFEDRNTYYAKQGKTVETIWKKVTDKYYVFKNWYADRNLYHLVGMLRFLKISISKIQEEFNKSENLDDFKNRLKQMCLDIVFQKDEKSEYTIKLDDLAYGDPSVKDVLVLFNVFSAMRYEKSDYRFSFKDLYGQKYDIEHIYCQTPKDKTGDNRIDWIDTSLEYFSGIEKVYDGDSKIQKTNDKVFLNAVKSKISSLSINLNENITNGWICQQLLEIRDKKTDITTEPVYKEIEKLFDMKSLSEDKVNGISNLALLDSGTNRGYKNAFFPVKRKWIISREKYGIFIPLCTKNIFMKAYSSNMSDLMNWTDTDAQAYYDTIKEVLGV